MQLRVSLVLVVLLWHSLQAHEALRLFHAEADIFSQQSTYTDVVSDILAINDLANLYSWLKARARFLYTISDDMSDMSLWNLRAFTVMYRGSTSVR